MEGTIRGRSNKEVDPSVGAAYNRQGHYLVEV